MYSNNFGIGSVPNNDFDSGGQMMVWGYGGNGVDMGGGMISPSNLFVSELEGLSGPPSGIGDMPSATASDMNVYPNPFNPTTTVSYTLDQAAVASVHVYDVRGRLVENLVPQRSHAAGRHTVDFEASVSGVLLRYAARGGRGADDQDDRDQVV